MMPNLVLVAFCILSLCGTAMSSASTSCARAAIAQLRSTSSKYQNLVNIAKCAGWAKRAGAQMLFLPECFGFMSENSQQTLEQAEPPLQENYPTNDPAMSEVLRSMVNECTKEGEGKHDEVSKDVDPTELQIDPIYLLDGIKTIAKASDLWISGGGMHVSGAPSLSSSENERARVYNTHVVVNNEGIVKKYYNKIHLFDVSIPGKVNLRESNTTAPGTELAICDSPLGKLGLSTCYDMRFPEMYISLVQQGAQIILAPSAFTVPTGSAHWHTLLRARAIESQCYVFASAQYGRHNEKRESYGHSLAVDPWGTVIADAGGCDGKGTVDSESERSPPSIVLCDVDLKKLDSIRQRMPIQLHRDSSSF